MPTVSIIIPTYNRSALLKQALLSCLDQTYRDFEIIVVDDGSTDDTRKMVEGLNSQQIVYIHQSNRGRSRARNRALSKARGKYIAFLDSDDMYLPEKLAVQVKALDENPSYSAAYTSAFNIDFDGNFHPYVYEATAGGWIYKDIALYIPLTICLPTVMVRREVFDKVGLFDPKLSRFEDTDMWRRIAKISPYLSISEPLCKIRYHEGNEMESPLKLYRALKYYTDKVIREDEPIYGAEIRTMAAKLWHHYGKAVLYHKNKNYNKRAMLFIATSLYLDPDWFIESRYLDYFDAVTALMIRQAHDASRELTGGQRDLNILKVLLTFHLYRWFSKAASKCRLASHQAQLFAMKRKRRIIAQLELAAYHTVLFAMNCKRRIMGQPLAGGQPDASAHKQSEECSLVSSKN